MFTNINSNKDELVQLVLVGQPELRRMVRQPGLHQFAQRVAASFHLPAMDAATVKAYIDHRLRVAGAQRTIFTASACEVVHAATGGVPRLVNQLCDFAMVYAYTRNLTTVPRQIVQQVLDDGVFFGAAPPEPPAAAPAPGSGALLVLGEHQRKQAD
jgi:type II secretory pathway predicted ATPase ExeA